MTTLRIQHLNKFYGGSHSRKIHVLKDINLTFHSGELVSIIGKSGVGKSTLIDILGGLDKKYNGHIFVNNQDIHKLHHKKLDKYRRKQIGFVFQSFHLIQHLTVYGNIMVALQMVKMPSIKRKQIAYQLINQVGLSTQIRKYPNQLSGGQQQRVSIARALASDPNILVADEPTGALDPQNTKDVLHILQKVAHSGKLVLVVTHSQKLTKYSSRVVYLRDGKVVNDRNLNIQSSSPAINNKKTEDQKTRPLPRHILWSMALKRLKKHWVQNLLTIIGGAVGITAVLLILGLGKGTKKYVNNQINSEINPNVSMIVPQASKGSFTNNAVKQISNVSGVKHVDAGVTIPNVFVHTLNKTKKVDSIGADSAMIRKSNLKYGKLPINHQILLPLSVAKDITAHPKKLVGKNINISIQSMNKGESKKTVQISGISDNGSNSINTTENTVRSLTKQADIPYKPQYLIAHLKGNTSRIAKIQNKISKIKKDNKKKYKVMGTSSTILKTVNTYVMIIILVLASIAGISLLVAAIMISSILFINVSNATEEIGILRALGASKSNVRKLFTYQSFLLGLFSWIISVMISKGLQPIINKLTIHYVHFGLVQLSILPIISLLVITLIVNFIAAILPAWHASRLDPVKSLKK